MNVISRRSCLKSGAAFLAMAAIHKAWALPSGVPLGVQLYSVGDELKRDVAGTLKRIKAIGYARVETAGLAGLSSMEFRKRLDEVGLTCLSTHLQLSAGTLALGNSRSALGDKELGVLFDEAHALGAHYVVSSAIFAPTSAGTPKLEDYRVMADRVNDLALRAKKAGLQYAYHNHNFEFRKLEGGTMGYDVLLERTDAAVVDFEMDCGWVVTAGHKPAEYFARYPNRYTMLHIKDFAGGDTVSVSLEQGERPQGTELGRGHIDYKPILAAAAKAGIDDYYVEQEPPFLEMKALDAVKVDYDYLRAI